MDEKADTSGIRTCTVRVVGCGKQSVRDSGVGKISRDGERVVRTFTDVFVSVHRGVVTLRDLEIELVRMLNARRVRRLTSHVNDDPVRFDNFGMGSLLRQSCVIHYFRPPPEMRVIPDVRSQDVLSHLCDYRATNQTKLSFLSYLLNKLKIPSLYHGGILLSEEYFSSSSSIDEMQIIANVTNARKCRMFAQLQKSREELASASRDTATSSLQKRRSFRLCVNRYVRWQPNL